MRIAEWYKMATILQLIHATLIYSTSLILNIRVVDKKVLGDQYHVIISTRAQV